MRTRTLSVPTLCVVLISLIAVASPSLADRARAAKVLVCHVNGDGRIIPRMLPPSAERAHLRHGDVRPLKFFIDEDGDSFSAEDAPSIESCLPEGSYTAWSQADPADCDDADADINPGMVEILGNGIDDDCNSQTPDANADACTTARYFRDEDGDSFTSENAPSIELCLPEGVYTELSQSVPADCDDTDADINPGMLEVSDNGLDDDCNSQTPDTIPDTCTTTRYFRDEDGDRYTPENAPSIESCLPDGVYTELSQSVPADCDDSNAAVNPGMLEVLGNGLDDDCRVQTPDVNPSSCDINFSAVGYDVSCRFVGSTQFCTPTLCAARYSGTPSGFSQCRDGFRTGTFEGCVPTPVQLE